ncbi:MAG: xanthine dehydrogenase molybdopterin binding subunit [Planctomycetes bacterium]|nr:xanthine dehydrogenase molybdopterin binding subunit [Planctomycetota bacterium]
MTDRGHASAVAHVTGEALFVHDQAQRDGNALYGWPVQAAHAHARVLHIDEGPALALPGVRAVLTAADVPGTNWIGPARHDEALFPDEVQYHGQPVCWVLADDEATARAGAAAVRIDCEVLPALRSLDAAIAAGSFHTAPQAIAAGDVAAALAAAPHRFAGELRLPAQEHFYLETQAAYVRPDGEGGYHVLAATQHPAETQATVAHVLGLPAHRVTVEVVRIGGGFGGKESQASGVAAVAAVGCARTGRPVAIRLDRQRDATITGKRHPFLAKWRAGAGPDGRLVAFDVELCGDGGSSLDLSKAILARALFHVDGAYAVPALRVVGRVARTNLPSNTAFRGFGAPQAAAVAEEVQDHVARALGLPPETVRERNLYRPGDRTHYGQPVRDAERIGRIWRELLASSRFAERRAAIAAWNGAHAHHKRGIAITPVKFGIGFTTTFLNQAGAHVLVYRDGSVLGRHGGTEMGQGLHTKILAVAARTLGVPESGVRIVSTRTDQVPNTSATAASSGSDLNGAAVAAAARELRQRLLPHAAALLGCAPEAVEFAAGSALGAGRAVPFAAVVEAAFLARTSLAATGFHATPGLHFDAAAGRGEPFGYFVFGAAVSEVEVDGCTGQHRLLAVDVLHDVGDSLAPAIDRGQIEGGFVQGVGWLTCEEVRFGPAGELLTRNASTYKLPGIGECPAGFRVATLERATEPGAVFGSKAVGEPPFLLALSVREALRDAVAAFRGPGPVALDCPATPEAVYWAIHGRPDAEPPAD